MEGQPDELIVGSLMQEPASKRIKAKVGRQIRVRLPLVCQRRVKRSRFQFFSKSLCFSFLVFKVAHCIRFRQFQPYPFVKNKDSSSWTAVF